MSPTGSDANPGSKAKPFATLEHARDVVRELKRAGKVHQAGLTVWLRGGDFLRTNAFELTAADSGTLNGPVVWRAYGNERVRLLGGRALTGFQPVSDAAVGVTITGGTNHGVVSCDVFETGDGGVSLSGGDRQTLTPGGHFV